MTDGEMQRAYLSLFNRVNSTGFLTKKNAIDNEISNSMRTLIRTECNLELELVPPHCHRRKVEEVPIKAFKQHFISIIAGVATYFPMSQWEPLLPQT